MGHAGWLPCLRRSSVLRLLALILDGGTLDHPVCRTADALGTAHGLQVQAFLDLFQGLFGLLSPLGQGLALHWSAKA